MKKQKKKVKKGFIKFCVIILILFGIGNLVYYGFGHNIKNIYVLNNNYLSDQEIIDIAGLNNYPNFYTTSSSSIKKKLKSNILVKDVKIKKRLFNKLYIYVDEYEILFYNQNTSKYVLENKKEISLNGIVVPTLINYVPDTKYDIFVNPTGGVNEDYVLRVAHIGDTTIEDNIMLVETMKLVIKEITGK